MNILIVILLFIIIIVIGFLYITNKKVKLENKIKYLNEFKAKYSRLVYEYNHEKEFDKYNYQWLIKNSVKIQNEMGVYGKMDYKPPFMNIIHRNYEYILNTLPQFKTNSVHPIDIDGVENTIIRYIGVLEEKYNIVFNELKNPLKWFIYGMKQLIAIPIYILSWFGLINNSSIEKIISNTFIKVFSGIISLIAFISGIFTIIISWDEFLELIKNIFN